MLSVESTAGSGPRREGEKYKVESLQWQDPAAGGVLLTV